MGKLEKIESFIVESLEKDSKIWVGQKYGLDHNNQASYFEIEDAGVYFEDDDIVCELSGTSYFHLRSAISHSDHLTDVEDELWDVEENFERGSAAANKKIDELWKKVEEAREDIIEEIYDFTYETLDMIDYNDSPISQYEVQFEINDSSVSTTSMEALINLVAPGSRYYNTIGNVKPILIGFDRDTFEEYIY